MNATILQLTPRDPLIAREGRPFGSGWPLPSVVAGSFRAALVKANPALSFSGDMPERLKKVEVAGLFPTVVRELYLPAPNDCAWDEKTNRIHRLQPIPFEPGDGVDFPLGGLDPVRLTIEQAKDDFKAKTVPSWWPLQRYVEWLTDAQSRYDPEWFDAKFLTGPNVEARDHAGIYANPRKTADGRNCRTTGLNMTYLPRFGVPETKPFRERYAQIALSVRVMTAETDFEHVEHLSEWRPLGGERRLVHWRSSKASLWTCPESIRAALASAARIRMVLATPAIFDHGWWPDWLDAGTLAGRPFSGGPILKLLGVIHQPWKAVSGWSLAPPRGPKAIRRMVPAGSVYFFQKVEGDGQSLADKAWLNPVSDALQDQNDGFGLAIWGNW
jgi:CRISPR-associated protein Cmr3